MDSTNYWMDFKLKWMKNPGMDEGRILNAVCVRLFQNATNWCFNGIMEGKISTDFSNFILVKELINA